MSVQHILEYFKIHFTFLSRKNNLIVIKILIIKYQKETKIYNYLIRHELFDMMIGVSQYQRMHEQTEREKSDQ